MKIYREVKVSDRLPSKGGKHNSDKGIVFFNKIRQKFEDYNSSDSIKVEYWLEVVELPSEKEIEQEEYNNFIQSDRNHYFKDGFKTGTNYILDFLNK